MPRLLHLIFLSLGAFLRAEDRTWQSTCCGVGRSFPKNWTDSTCWSKSTNPLPNLNDRAVFQLTTNCIVRINIADFVSVQQLFVQNVGLQMQIVGPGTASRNSMTASTISVSSYSTLTMIGVNIILSGSSSLTGTLNLTNCQATGNGNITITTAAQLSLLQSTSMTLQFDVAVINQGLMTIEANSFLSSSKLENSGQLEVDIPVISQLQGVFWPHDP